MQKIVICEDHTIVSDGLILLFKEHPKYAIAGTCKTGKELLPLINDCEPDLLLLDLNLPDTDGLTLLETIRKENKELKIIILTMYNNELLIKKAQQGGANAYLLKNVDNEELLKALEKIESGQFYVSQTIQKENEKKKIFQDQFVNKMKLTTREIEIIKILAQGKSSIEAAKELSLSSHTIDTHRKNIFKKLDINSIIELVNFAHEHKLI